MRLHPSPACTQVPDDPSLVSIPTSLRHCPQQEHKPKAQETVRCMAVYYWSQWGTATASRAISRLSTVQCGQGTQEKDAVTNLFEDLRSPYVENFARIPSM
ncbi:hypothetical protein FOCC_FOCC013214 [Frankliniella occidentalis]|nr:hypothetical protein FOCC_FOCC013214 [Frankliniella occidentalis]